MRFTTDQESSSEMTFVARATKINLKNMKTKLMIQ